MTIMLKQSVAFLIALLLLGCENAAQDTPTAVPRIRAAFRASGTGTVKATVYAEGPDGNALSGAVVTVQDERNSILPLNYEAASCSYSGILDEFTGDTQYIIQVSSVLHDGPLLLAVPYTVLSQKPNVTVFQDAGGNSVLNGQSIASGLPVQIAWFLCGDDVVYQVALKTALKTVYAASTAAGTLTIPANALPPGSYMLEIIAQKINGDMNFRSAPYYSVSVVNAPMVSCNVN